jgi:hypothetical protein
MVCHRYVYHYKERAITLDNFIPLLLDSSGAKHHQIYQALLKIIIHQPLLERPGRSEPRVRKRRPKAYPSMKQPRNQLRPQLQAV